jgi:long-chain acyl-CoA synthetase
MLYNRWRQVAQEHASERALHDLNSGRTWTFKQLFEAAEAEPKPVQAALFPQATGPEFVLSVLVAWKHGNVLCPLEPGQAAPALASLPPDYVHLKTTSGSAGHPRLVAFTASQLAADVANIVQSMGLRPDCPNLGVISLAHSYGFSNLVLPLLLHGIPLLLGPAPLPQTVRAACALHAQLTVPAVPALWRAWLEADAIQPQIQLAISAGAPLPLPLEQSIFERLGLKVHTFYGATECGGIAYDRSLIPRTDPTLAGTALDNVSLTLAADGCLQVHSRAVGASYWPEPSPDLSNGIYHTADLAEITDGQVFLRGRASDWINVAGRKVSPESIERVLATHPAVQQTLVLSVPSADSGRGEDILAVVAGDPTPIEELKRFLLDRLPAWQVPREWWLLSSLEANPRGKFSRALWREKWLERKRSLDRRAKS